MKRTTEEIMGNFVYLANKLSPENLHCDGEASPEHVKATLQSINKQWKNLEQEIGHSVTEDEAWKFQSSSKEKATIKKNFFGKSI